MRRGLLGRLTSMQGHFAQDFGQIRRLIAAVFGLGRRLRGSR
jgi:hypothetical protein